MFRVCPRSCKTPLVRLFKMRPWGSMERSMTICFPFHPGRGGARSSGRNDYCGEAGVQTPRKLPQIIVCSCGSTVAVYHLSLVTLSTSQRMRSMMPAMSMALSVSWASDAV